MTELDLKLKDDYKFEEIVTLEERKRQYAEFEAEEERKREE